MASMTELRFLRRGRVVQVYEGFAVHELLQRGKFFPDPADIEASDHRGNAVGSGAHRTASGCIAWGKACVMILSR